MDSYLHRVVGLYPSLVGALGNGQVVLVVHARTEAETTMAQQVVSQLIDLPAAPMSSKT